jgi:putative membrane protein
MRTAKSAKTGSAPTAHDAAYVRASPIDVFVYAATLLAPLAARISFRLARNHDHDRHRRIQLSLLGLCVIAVMALETEIRLSGGSGALMSQTPAPLLPVVRAVLIVHIAVAVLTYSAWAVLAFMSNRRFRGSLPGAWSRRHKQVGKLIFVGLVFTAMSATGMFFAAFVL